MLLVHKIALETSRHMLLRLLGLSCPKFYRRITMKESYEPIMMQCGHFSTGICDEFSVGLGEGSLPCCTICRYTRLSYHDHRWITPWENPPSLRGREARCIGMDGTCGLTAKSSSNLYMFRYRKDLGMDEWMCDSCSNVENTEPLKQS